MQAGFCWLGAAGCPIQAAFWLEWGSWFSVSQLYSSRGSRRFRERCITESFGHAAIHHWSNQPHLPYQFVELVREDRLLPVGEGAVGIVVNFNDQSVRAYGNRRARKWSDFVALARAMARIDQDR